MRSQVDISIILEWENVLLSGDDRCTEMLSILRSQLNQIKQSVEIIVLFNAEQIERSQIEPLLQQYLLSNCDTDTLNLRLEEANGLHYYELKNEGARRAKGEIIVFIDSDVLPEENWLPMISQPFFNDTTIEVVAGETYLSFDNLYEKAFALGWFFPLRNSNSELHANGKGFVANNVAFRRETFLRFSFPKEPEGLTRGACGQLAKSLIDADIDIWTNTAARAQHPPPTGIKHYLVRALADGRDHAMRQLSDNFSVFTILENSFKWSIKRIGNTVHAIKVSRQHVGLSLWQAPAAFVVMAFFYSLSFIGTVLTLLFPKYAKNHWVL
jgi:hypothetical protein